MTQPDDGWPGPPIPAWPHDRRRTPFYIPVSYNIPPPIGQSRPATNLAYHWLAHDLYALGWLARGASFYD